MICISNVSNNTGIFRTFFGATINQSFLDNCTVVSFTYSFTYNNTCIQVGGPGHLLFFK